MLALKWMIVAPEMHNSNECTVRPKRNKQKVIKFKLTHRSQIGLHATGTCSFTVPRWSPLVVAPGGAPQGCPLGSPPGGCPPGMPPALSPGGDPWGCSRWLPLVVAPGGAPWRCPPAVPPGSAVPGGAGCGGVML